MALSAPRELCRSLCPPRELCQSLCPPQELCWSLCPLGALPGRSDSRGSAVRAGGAGLDPASTARAGLSQPCHRLFLRALSHMSFCALLSLPQLHRVRRFPGRRDAGFPPVPCAKDQHE